MEIDLQVMSTRAMSLLESGRANEAMKLFREITSIDAENTGAWIMLGAINGEFGSAIMLRQMKYLAVFWWQITNFMKRPAALGWYLNRIRNMAKPGPFLPV